jgi:hypothetical protein
MYGFYTFLNFRYGIVLKSCFIMPLRHVRNIGSLHLSFEVPRRSRTFRDFEFLAHFLFFLFN